MLTGIEPYENLANAIVEQAVEDYKTALLKLERNPNNKHAKLDAFRLERFFHSDWYGKLTELDPDRLMNGARILVKKEAARKEVNRLKRKYNAHKKALLAVIEDCDGKEWEITEEDGSRLAELVFEAMDSLEEVSAAQTETDVIGAKAIRSVGFQVRE